jgi:hypothetical protein
VSEETEKARLLRNALRGQVKDAKEIVDMRLRDHREAKEKYLGALDRYLRLREAYRAQREAHRVARLGDHRLHSVKGGE